jgi:hypothetical protein
VDNVAIPDEALRYGLAEIVLNGGIDPNQLSAITLTKEQLKDVREFHWSIIDRKECNKEYIETIDDLEGIQFCTNLEELILDHNYLNDISTLASLTRMRRLALCNNEFSDIGVLANMDKLTWLNLSYNHHLRDISALQNCKKLESVYFYDTRVNDFSALVNLPNLREIRWSFCTTGYAQDPDPILSNRLDMINALKKLKHKNVTLNLGYEYQNIIEKL